jgi:hypothetical protein
MNPAHISRKVDYFFDGYWQTEKYFDTISTEIRISDEQFEAIFADPITYIKNILGTDLYGCVLRKTDVSSKWWDIYLKKIKDASIITSNKMKEKQNYE